MDDALAPMPVLFWPTGAVDPCASVFVLALHLDPALPRPQARAQLRAALRAALAARLGLPEEVITLNAALGQAPSLEGPGISASIGLSFSHEAGISLAAVNLLGPVGLDVVRDETPPDWQAVACDYLGPQVAAGLQAQGFPAAWAAHEARLKFHGKALREWQAEMAQPPWLAACHCQALHLPPGWVGSLALPAGQQVQGAARV